METILSAKDLERTYCIGKRSLDVLKNVSLNVNEGETVSIMGESGSGKSTLLHVLGGLDTPKIGAVHFRGQDVYRMSSRRRARFRAENVGFVFPVVPSAFGTGYRGKRGVAGNGQTREQKPG